jgi:transcriptional regulator
MYIPKYFRLTDHQQIREVIEAYSFATLFSQHQGSPYATHLPLMIDEDMETIYGHFARANPQWKDIDQQTVLAIFQGPHCYISPTWYETKHAVPTWNYVTVHVTGKFEIITDEQLIEDNLKKLVAKYEGPTSPYVLEDVDADYLAGLNKGIQSFKISIQNIEAKAKLSQNHPHERQASVIQKLEERDELFDKEIATLMKRNLTTLLPDHK